MKTLRTILPLFVAAFVALSCVHQFPEPTTPADVVLTLKFDTELPLYKTVQFPDETKADVLPDGIEGFQQDFSDHERFDVRYTIEAYPKFANGNMAQSASQRWVFTEDDASQIDDYEVKLSIGEGEYEFRVWVDYVEQGQINDLYYVTNNWKEGIKVNHANGHQGNTDWRDAYAGKASVNVVRYGTIAEPTHLDVEMARPLGKYIFVTNDLDEFVTKVLQTKAQESGFTKVPEFNIDDYTLVIAYTGFMPSSYSMVTNRANDSEVNVRFYSKMQKINETTAIMGADYVYANPKNTTLTSVIMGLELRDKDGTVLASHNSARVPIQRGEYTVVEGRFLMQESSGGITLNPDFEGEFVVPVN